MSKCYEYVFTVHIIGQGDNEEEAWQDACDAFALYPGIPDSFEVYPREEE